MAKRKGFTAKAGRRKARPGGARSRKARFGGRARRRSHGGARGFGGGGFRFMGVDLVSGLVGGAGAVLSGIGTNLAAKYVPVPQLQTGPGKIALRLGVTVLGSMLAKKALPPKISNPLIGGAVVGFGIDLVQTFVMPSVSAAVPALSGYESTEDTLAALEVMRPGTLNGIMAVDGGQPLFSFN